MKKKGGKKANKIKRKLHFKKFKLNNIYTLLRNINIKYRLIFFYGFLILMIILVTGVISLVQYRDAINDKSKKFSSQITTQIKRNISNEMDKHMDLAKSLAMEAELQDYLQNNKTMDYNTKYDAINSLSKLMRLRALSNKNIQNLSIIDNENSSLGNTSLSIMEYLKNNEVKETRWILKKDDDAYSIYNITPINFSNNGKKIGLLVQEIDPNIFSNILKDIDLGEASSVSIVSLDGTIIGNADKINIGQKYKDGKIIEDLNKEVSSLEAEGVKEKTFSDSKGKELISFASIDTNDWYLLSNIPYSYLNKKANVIGVNILIIGLIAFIVAISEETEATTREVAGVTQEQIKEIEKISDFSKKLDKIVVKLNNTISYFHIED